MTSEKNKGFGVSINHLLILIYLTFVVDVFFSLKLEIFLVCILINQLNNVVSTYRSVDESLFYFKKFTLFLL